VYRIEARPKQQQKNKTNRHRTQSNSSEDMGCDAESDHGATTAAGGCGGAAASDGDGDGEDVGGGTLQAPQWDPNLLLKLNIYHTEDANAGGAAAGSSDKSKRLYVLDLQLSRGHVCEFMQLSLKVIALLKTRR
jgi:hypothetical protein